MKRSITIALCTLILFACKKENKVQQLRYKFSGTWEYERNFGYGIITTSLPPGNGRIIVLSSNGSFERRQQDTLLFKGVYSIESRKLCSERESELFFTTNDTSRIWDNSISIEGDKLMLSTSACYIDGGGTSYRKIR